MKGVTLLCSGDFVGVGLLLNCHIFILVTVSGGIRNVSTTAATKKVFGIVGWP